VNFKGTVFTLPKFHKQSMNFRLILWVIHQIRISESSNQLEGRIQHCLKFSLIRIRLMWIFPRKVLTDSAPKNFLDIRYSTSGFWRFYICQVDSQFYVQLVYEQYFGTWIILFGTCWQSRMKNKIWVFLSNFWGCFFHFLGGAKMKLISKKKRCSIRAKELYL
jgi:hypothetical protein